MSEFNPVPTNYPNYTFHIQNSALFSNLELTLQNFPKSGHFRLADTLLLHQRCPLIGENTVGYSIFLSVLPRNITAPRILLSFPLINSVIRPCNHFCCGYISSCMCTMSPILGLILFVPFGIP